MVWMLAFFLVPSTALTLYWLYKEYTDPIKEPTKQEMEERARRLKEKYCSQEPEKEEIKNKE